MGPKKEVKYLFSTRTRFQKWKKSFTIRFLWNQFFLFLFLKIDQSVSKLSFQAFDLREMIHLKDHIKISLRCTSLDDVAKKVSFK